MNLSDLTVVVAGPADSPDWTPDLVNVEVLDEIVLDSKETRTVSIGYTRQRAHILSSHSKIPLSILAKRPMTLQITDVSYSFLSLLPAKESLVTRGRRLQDTPLQRQNKVYAPDVVVKVEIEDATQRLSAEFFDDNRLILYHGERKQMRIWLSNVGTQSIGEIWLVGGQEDEFWVEESEGQGVGARYTSAFSPLRWLTLHSRNVGAFFRDLSFRQFSTPPNTVQNSVSLYRKSITFSGCQPGNSVYSPRKQTRRAGTLFVVQFSGGTWYPLGYHRFLRFNTTQGDGTAFHCVRLARCFEVRPLLSATVTSGPGQRLENLFTSCLDVRNISASAAVTLSQVVTLSPTWSCNPLTSVNR